MNATPEYEERILNARPDTDKFSFRKVDSKVSKVMQDRKLLEDIKTWASKLQREGGSSSLHVSIERERSESAPLYLDQQDSPRPCLKPNIWEGF